MVALDVNVVILAVDEEETELGDSLKAQVVSKECAQPQATRSTWKRGKRR